MAVRHRYHREGAPEVPLQTLRVSSRREKAASMSLGVMESARDLRRRCDWAGVPSFIQRCSITSGTARRRAGSGWSS